MYRANKAKSLNLSANMSTGSTSTESTSTSASVSTNIVQVTNVNNNLHQTHPTKSSLNSDETSDNKILTNKNKLEFNRNNEEHTYEEEIYNEQEDDENVNDIEDDEEVNDDDDDNDEEESQLDKEELSIYPISVVQVKYAVNYDYDDNKFELLQGEKLNLYEKTNHDWWLCSHLNNEKAKFFVPASYVKDLGERKFNMKPPPRPPPPPIAVLKQLASTTTTAAAKTSESSIDSNISRPQPKPRQTFENKSNKPNQDNNAEDIYENLSDLTLNSVHNMNSNNNNNNNNEYDPNSPNKIISELDECLNNQEFGFNLNQPKKANNQNDSDKNKSSSITISNDTSTTTIGTNTTTATNLGVSSTPEPDYDDDHIYQNLPIVSTSSINSLTKNKSIAQISSSDKENEYADDNSSELIDEKNVNKCEIDLSGEHEVEDHYEDGEEAIEEEDEDEEEDDTNDDEYNNDDNEDDIEIPDGWKVGMSNCKRKFFYNSVNKDRWYLNHDENGKCYFYNANNESLWELPPLYKNKNDNLTEEIYEEDENDRSTHFKQEFDSDLPTFRSLYSRLSTRKAPNQEISSKINESVGATGYSYNSNHNDSTTAPTKASILYNKADATISATSSHQQPTVSYSHKPPSDLSNKFKCIVLAKGGKRVKKKNSENYNVILISTKIGFVKEGKLNSHPKMEFSLDFKGGKCYKIENQKSKLANNCKDTNNNNNNNGEDSKNSKEKNKESAEIVELIGTRNAFVIETTNGYKILIINDSEKIIDEWVYAINSIITQFQSEFSPIYEGPEHLHSTKKLNDMFVEKSKLVSSLSSTENTKTGKSKSKEYENEIEKETSKGDNIDDTDKLIEKNNTSTASSDKLILNRSNSRKKYKLLDKRHEKKQAVDAITYKNRHSSSFNINIKHTNENLSNNNDFYIKYNQDEQQQSSSKQPQYVKFFDNNNDSSSSSDLMTNSSSSSTNNYIEKKDLQIKRNIIIKTLNAFLKRRPPIETLKSQGIIKECVFGSNLINLCKKEKRNVPIFVEEIVAAIEAKGLDMDGIYRISGNLVDVQKVRQLVEHGKHNFKDFDIHVLCGALKTFFRELEDPLVPYSLHQYFLDTMKIQDKSKRFGHVHELVKKMPLSHRETLRYLLQHLLKVVMLSKENRMNVQNIALVFGPNIMRSNPINDAATFGFNPNIMTQNMVVEYLLTNFKELYSFQTNSIFTTDY